MIIELVIEPIRTDITADGPADVRPLRLTVSTVGPALPAMQIAEMTDAIAVAIAVINGAGPIAATRADIRARIDAGETTPVLASHLDALGLRDAVEQWARAAG